jgi:hypothetical protein
MINKKCIFASLTVVFTLTQLRAMEQGEKSDTQLIVQNEYTHNHHNGHMITILQPEVWMKIWPYVMDNEETLCNFASTSKIVPATPCFIKNLLRQFPLTPHVPGADAFYTVNERLVHMCKNDFVAYDQDTFATLLNSPFADPNYRHKRTTDEKIETGGYAWPYINGPYSLKSNFRYIHPILSFACTTAHVPAVRTLLNKGANPEYRVWLYYDLTTETDAPHLIRHRFNTMAHSVIESGASLEDQTTCLDLLITKGGGNILKKKCAKMHGGGSLLHTAATINPGIISHVLTKNVLAVNERQDRSASQQTPLMVLIRESKKNQTNDVIAGIKALMLQDANPHLTIPIDEWDDFAGKTVFDIAKQDDIDPAISALLHELDKGKEYYDAL